MIRTTRVMVLVVSLTMMTLIGSAALAGDGEDVQGNKARISVGTIETKADQCSSDMATAIGEMLSSTLANTGRYVVLAGQDDLAELLVTGTVTKFEPEAGGGGMLGGLKKKALGSAGASSSSAEINLEVKLTDVRTGNKLKSKKIKAKSTQWSADMTGYGWSEDLAMEGALGTYADAPMEDAIHTVLANSVEMISKEVPEEYYRYSDQAPAGSGQASAAGVAVAAAAPVSAATQTSTSAAAPAAEDMTLYTKYDFVPGNRVIFYDDLSDEEEGEFPYRWDLEKGVFEIARMGGEYWILCTDDGYILPKTPTGPLPDKYTVEMEFYSAGPEFTIPYYYIRWIDASGKEIGQFEFHSGNASSLQIQGKNLASKTLSDRLSKGTHTMRIMATTRSIKCYVDQIRVANVPKVEGFSPVGFKVRMYPYKHEGNHCMIKSYRFAEGGKSMRDQLDETGRIVTHGILFDPDSYVIKGESFKTLKNIGQLLEEDPALRLSIEGHTDSDGSEAHNSELSHNRSRAVVNYLIQNYGIDADRLEARGWGESRPMDTNDTAEGKANNRRVELVKL